MSFMSNNFFFTKSQLLSISGIVHTVLGKKFLCYNVSWGKTEDNNLFSNCKLLVFWNDLLNKTKLHYHGNKTRIPWGI